MSVLKHSQPWAWPCLEASRGGCSLDHSFIHVLRIRYTLLYYTCNLSCHVMMQLMNGGQDALMKALAVARGLTSAVMLTGDELVFCYNAHRLFACVVACVIPLPDTMQILVSWAYCAESALLTLLNGHAQTIAANEKGFKVDLSTLKPFSFAPH